MQTESTSSVSELWSTVLWWTNAINEKRHDRTRRQNQARPHETSSEPDRTRHRPKPGKTAPDKSRTRQDQMGPDADTDKIRQDQMQITTRKDHTTQVQNQTTSGRTTHRPQPGKTTPDKYRTKQDKIRQDKTQTRTRHRLVGTRNQLSPGHGCCFVRVVLNEGEASVLGLICGTRIHDDINHAVRHLTYETCRQYTLLVVYR